MDTTAKDDAEGVRADHDPLRTCVVTRRQLPVEDLIRFVADPSGAIVPDISCRLPGRGVWVSLDRKAVETAVRTRAFNRGLKREVKVPAELPDIVENLLVRRALEALSLANKAGLVSTGFTKIDAGIVGGKVAALLHSADAGDDGVEKLDRRYRAMCRDLDRPPQILRDFANDQMSLAIGRANVVHAALTKGGAAQFFLKQAGRLQRYRTGRLDVD